MEAEAKQVTHGWFETLRARAEEFFNQFELSWANVTEYLISFGASIFAGFLVKRYGRDVLITVILIGIALAIFSYFDFITIDWIKIKDLFGVAPAETIESFFQEYFQWIKIHIISVIIGIIGFIIGYKIG